MQSFLIILLVAALLATLVALVRGIVAFLQSASAEARGTGTSGPTQSQLKSNKMMQQRILFQALAVIIVVVLLFSAGRT
jgi:hypothetical protein